MILQNDLENKTILLGVTGGIAAYKTPNLIRLLKKKGANVIVVATSNALNFVTKLTLQTVSNNKVYVEEFDTKDFDIEHISLSKKADLMLIAPLSANTLGKIANGIADNLLTSIVLAFNKPVVICPAMNTNMWQNAFVQENLNKLKNYNYNIIEPISGLLACGDVGIGKMPDENLIVENIISVLNYKDKFLEGKNVLITAGGTSEPIDCVRYITNKSSGKMGLALAKQASYLGASVHLISTFEVCNPQFQVTQVQTALQMQNAVLKNFKKADIVIMAAAVSDFRCQNPSEQKIKKNSSDLTLNLVKNPDILTQISNEKHEKQIVVGFCAESQNLIENAKDKIKSKHCDFIVANDISNKNIGFNSDNNEVFIIDKNLNVQKIEFNTKDKIAYEILKYVSKNN